MIEPIVDEQSHKRALRRIEKLWNAQPGSSEEQELDALATLVDAYEQRAFPVLPLDAVEAIRTRCEQLGWTRRQLEPLIGSRARVSEVLSRKGIPADVLISEVSAGRSRRGSRRRRPTRAPAKSTVKRFGGRTKSSTS